MDEILYYFYNHGVLLLLSLAIVKIIIIFLYKGVDFWYLVDNFFSIYAELGMADFPRRRLFRLIHNIITIIFYSVCLCWAAIVMVVRLSK
jgi:hypothetical protein